MVFNSFPQFDLLNPLIDHRLLLTGQLLSIQFLPGKLITGDLSMIGWWLPCDMEGMHFGSHFELSGSKEHWERQQKELVRTAVCFLCEHSGRAVHKQWRLQDSFNEGC